MELAGALGVDLEAGADADEGVGAAPDQDGADEGRDGEVDGAAAEEGELRAGEERGADAGADDERAADRDVDVGDAGAGLAEAEAVGLLSRT